MIHLVTALCLSLAVSGCPADDPEYVISVEDYSRVCEEQSDCFLATIGDYCDGMVCQQDRLVAVSMAEWAGYLEEIRAAEDLCEFEQNRDQVNCGFEAECVATRCEVVNPIAE